MTQTLDRTKCRWRGHDMAKVSKALQTGEPAFKFRKYDAKCPVCGVLYKRQRSGDGCCSHSCKAKLYWQRWHKLKQGESEEECTNEKPGQR